MTETVITDAQLVLMGLVLVAGILVLKFKDRLSDLNLLDRFGSPGETRSPRKPERPDLAIVGYDDDIKRRVEIALTLAGRDLLGDPSLSWEDVQQIITWDQVLAYLEDLNRRVSALEA